MSLGSMRPLLIALSIALPLTASGQGWTLLENSPFHSYRFEDAAFVSPERGWIVNGAGETYETQDGGESWTLRSQVPGYLRTTAFPSAGLGWVGVLFNQNARLYETRDGGETMVNVTDRIQPAIGGGVCGLFALDETHVFGVGEWDGPSYFLKTTDGGASWQSVDMAPYAESLIDVRFTDPMNGIVVGGTNGTQSGGVAVILATSDGGETWTERFRSSGTGTSTEWAWKISFPSESVGYVSVEHYGGNGDGKVLKTIDGGLTWTELAVPGGGSMQGVGFLNEREGWTSGRGTQMVTSDGGVSWVETSAIDGSVNRFEFFGDSLGYAMGRRIYKLERLAVSAAPPPPDALTLSASPNPTASATTIRFRLGTPGDVVVDVFDTLGRRIARLAEDERPAGEHRLRWEADAPGTYLVRVQTPEGLVTRRIAVVR